MNTSLSTSRLSALKRCTLAAALLTTVTANALEAADAVIPEVLVTADFRAQSLQTTSASLTVMTDEIIRARSAQHLEDILSLAPNVNFASGTSRARYFQIRGIGERSQFSQPINPSVGFVVDEIDFSGIGTVATLFDVAQVEVLRGPQGTRYGANALAGLINIRSKAPSEELQATLSATAADYDSYSVGAAIGGPLIEGKLLGRLAVEQYQSDGFINNRFLNRDDTNNRDELTARGKLRWLISEDAQLDITLLQVDVDNGYDAFSLDNDRNTLSDEPGHDRQRSTALGLDLDWSLNDVMRLEALASVADSDLEYGYDEDWTYTGIHPDGYSAKDNYRRTRESYSVELRLLSDQQGMLFNGSTDWVVGFYHQVRDEDLHRQYTYLAEDYRSDYRTENSAVYGQLDIALSEKLTLITGLRAEQWQAEYDDSNNLKIDPDENLWGGKLGLDYQLNDQQLIYASIARGYKAGGVNTDGNLDDGYRGFDTEYLWNFEAGVKSSWLDNALFAQLSVFYAQREDMQVKGSETDIRIDGSTDFTDYIDNAAEGKNYGLEAELSWSVSESLQLFASLGVLEATLDDYVTPDGEDKSGRDQAHAPAYQFSLGGEYGFANGWFVRAELDGKDSFYFSDRHDEQSDSYELLSAKLGYRADHWSVTLWGRNLTDEDYQTRGFGFANDPRDFYASSGYVQLGEPRVIGVSANWNY
jgi:outer membrane receptor protein involved in Fe transport